MAVWVLIEKVKYEADTLLGVFSTPERAQSYASAQGLLRGVNDANWHSDDDGDFALQINRELSLHIEAFVIDRASGGEDGKHTSE